MSVDRQMNSPAVDSKLRTQAEALRIALDVGAASVDDAVAWARAVVTEADHPHWAFCELATCSGKYPPDLHEFLAAVPGVVDESSARALVVRMLADSLDAHPERADQIAESLYQLALAGDFNDSPLAEVAWWSWDALDLADAGHIAESRKDVIDQMKAALRAAALPAAETTPG